MSGPCPEISDRISRDLGGFDCSGPAFVHFRNPADLSNWTLPVLELLMVAGAALAIWYAIRRMRRAGDPTLVVLILAGLLYLALIEPILYFPNKAGLSDDTVMFVHNVFTVDFLYDRLPLYIVALYVALPVLAFEIVRTLGVFERRGGPVLGALAVGAVHSALYEVFDQLGPQLRWWAWNTGSENLHPMLASVPLPSAVMFAAVAPAGLAFLVYWLVGRAFARGERVRGAGLVWRTVVAGLLTPLVMTLAGIPLGLVGAPGVVLWAELALIWLIGGAALLRPWPERSPQAARSPRPERSVVPPGPVVRIFGPAYLAVLGLLWLTALPAFFDATGGVTADGTPIGNLPFTVLCFVASVVWVTLGARAHSSEPVREAVA